MKRIRNAAIIFCVSGAIVGVGWLISVGFYEIGLWPIGALIRVGVCAFAILGLYWIVRHLVHGEEGIVRGKIERMRGEAKRQSQK